METLQGLSASMWNLGGETLSASAIHLPIIWSTKGLSQASFLKVDFT